MPPKEYRWVDEMKEIAETMHDEGGFEKDLFSGVSEDYRFVADETELGKRRRRVGVWERRRRILRGLWERG